MLHIMKNKNCSIKNQQPMRVKGTHTVPKITEIWANLKSSICLEL